MKTAVFIISMLFSALLGFAQTNDEPEELLTAEQLLTSVPQDNRQSGPKRAVPR